MGKRGPAKTPTAQLKLHGSTLVKGRANEPQPDAGRPEVPDEMNAEAAEVWEQICPILEDMGVLTIADGNALIRYCNLFARWWKANQFLQDKGESYAIYAYDKDGSLVIDPTTGRKVVRYMQQWPQVTIERNTGTQLLRLEQEFGLTPSARAGLNVTKKTAGLPKRNQG